MIITLLTDFGTQDYFVGAMKGVVLSINPGALIIDITHEIPPQDARAAAFTLANYYRTFPPRTVHLCVVDPGVGSARRAILAETPEYFFVAPDNGLLSVVFDEFENPEKASPADLRVRELTDEKYFRHPVSRTFHGRDIFAPVAAYLSKGVEPGEFGREIEDFVRFAAKAPETISASETRAEIVHADRFGNLITNLKTADLPESFVLAVNGKQIEKHHKFYAEAETAGEIFSIGGSAGLLEICAFRRSAKQLLKAKAGDPVYLKKR